MPRSKPEPTRRQRWLPYVRRIADLIALKDWRIEIAEDEPSQSYAIANVEPIQGRRFATIRLSNGFFDDKPPSQRDTIIHELIHCHFAIYVHAVEKKTKDDSVLHMLMEHAVDSIAQGMSCHLPLPPKE